MLLEGIQPIFHFTSKQDEQKKVLTETFLELKEKKTWP